MPGAWRLLPCTGDPGTQPTPTHRGPLVGTQRAALKRRTAATAATELAVPLLPGSNCKLSQQVFIHVDKLKGSNLLVTAEILSSGQAKRIKFAYPSTDFVIWTSKKDQICFCQHEFYHVDKHKRIKFAYPSRDFVIWTTKRIKFVCLSTNFVMWTSKRDQICLSHHRFSHVDKHLCEWASNPAIFTKCHLTIYSPCMIYTKRRRH